MGVNIETGRFEAPKSSRFKIPATSVTAASVILITLELEENGEKECYVRSREAGVGFEVFVENKESHTHFINWAVIN